MIFRTDDGWEWRGASADALRDAMDDAESYAFRPLDGADEMRPLGAFAPSEFRALEGLDQKDHDAA